MLANGPNDAVGTRSINLVEPAGAAEHAGPDVFQTTPEMPTLEAMREFVAKHPTVQSRLLSLMEELVHAELHCVKDVDIGKTSALAIELPTGRCRLCLNGRAGLGKLPSISDEAV